MGPRFVPCAGPALPSPSITCLWAVSGLGGGVVSKWGVNRPPPPRLLMDLGLRGQTAPVAAASRGLGKAVAKLFVEEGARVAICSRRKEAVDAAAAEIGGEVLPVTADVSKAEDIDRFVQAAAAKFGRIDILVNNAGGPPAGPFVEITDEQWWAGIGLNLMSTVRLSRAVIPHMRRQGGGRIINIASYVDKQPLPNLVLSNAVRLAVVGLAKTLAAELGPDTLLVNSVCPGPLAPELLESLTKAVPAP